MKNYIVLDCKGFESSTSNGCAEVGSNKDTETF